MCWPDCSFFFGIGVFFAPRRVNIIAGLIYIGAGIVAYHQKTFIPLVIALGLLYILKLLGFDKNNY